MPQKVWHIVFLAYVPQSVAQVRKHWFCSSHCSVLEELSFHITLAIRRGDELTLSPIRDW